MTTQKLAHVLSVLPTIPWAVRPTMTSTTPGVLETPNWTGMEPRVDRGHTKGRVLRERLPPGLVTRLVTQATKI